MAPQNKVRCSGNFETGPNLVSGLQPSSNTNDSLGPRVYSRNSNTHRKSTKRKSQNNNPPESYNQQPTIAKDSLEVDQSPEQSGASISNLGSCGDSRKSETGNSLGREKLAAQGHPSEKLGAPPTSQKHLQSINNKAGSNPTNMAAAGPIPASNNLSAISSAGLNQNGCSPHRQPITFTEKETRLIESALFISDVKIPRDRERCMMMFNNLKRQGVSITLEVLNEECLKIMQSQSTESNKGIASFPNMINGGNVDGVNLYAVSATCASFNNGIEHHVDNNLPVENQATSGGASNGQDQVDARTPSTTHNSAALSSQGFSVSGQSIRSNPASSIGDDEVDGATFSACAGNKNYEKVSKFSQKWPSNNNHRNNAATTTSAVVDDATSTDASGRNATQVTDSVENTRRSSEQNKGNRQTGATNNSALLDSAASLNNDNSMNNTEHRAISPNSDRKNVGVTGKPQPLLAKVNPAKYKAICVELTRRENKRLDKARYCGECETKQRDITFLPCGHVWACRSCAEPLYVCPCCQRNIIATVNTFMC